MGLRSQIQQFEERLRQIAPLCVGAFFASCAERLFPLYETFVQREGWGNVQTIRGALDAAWNQICNHEMPVSGVKAVLAAIDANVPGDPFPTPGVSYAQDVCICVHTAIRSLCEDPREKIDLDLWYAWETVRMAACLSLTGTELNYPPGPEGSRMDEKVLVHPWIVTEIANQEADLNDLSTKPLTVDLVARIRERARERAWTADILHWFP